jgi:hypothetical protein
MSNLSNYLVDINKHTKKDEGWFTNFYFK